MTLWKKFLSSWSRKGQWLYLLGFEKNKENLENADFILCTGFLDNHENSLTLL